MQTNSSQRGSAAARHVRVRLLEHVIAALALLMCAAPGTVAAAPASGTVPLQFDGGRIDTLQVDAPVTAF